MSATKNRLFADLIAPWILAASRSDAACHRGVARASPTLGDTDQLPYGQPSSSLFNTPPPPPPPLIVLALLHRHEPVKNTTHRIRHDLVRRPRNVQDL